MPRYLPTRDGLRPDADRINSLIRRLMGKPVSRARTAEWQRLMVAWSEAPRPDDVEPAA